MRSTRLSLVLNNTSFLVKGTPTVSVLGLGNWGTALAHHLAEKGIAVTGWSREPDVVISIRDSRRHPHCLKEFELSSNIHATGDLEQALAAQFIVLVTPSDALVEMVPAIARAEDAIVVSAVKGFEMQSRTTPLGYLARIAPQLNQTVAFSGPSFAHDVTSGKPCGIVAASRNSSAAAQVAQLFSGRSMKVYTSDDPIGVELGGAVKNVIAVAAGVSDGLDLGDSARAGLITRGLAEMMRLAHALGAKRETLAGLSGLGDLSMTATSSQSRNRTVGYRLGRGEKLQEIIQSLGSVAEGVRSAPIVEALALEHKVDMPIVHAVGKLLRSEFGAHELARELVARPTKAEF